MAEQCARKSNENSESRCSTQLVMTSNQWGNLGQMSKWETKTDEEPLEAEIPRVRMNPKNPTSREKQEHEDSGHAVNRSWCAACVEGRGVGVQHRIELLEEEEREKNDSERSFRLRFS